MITLRRPWALDKRRSIPNFIFRFLMRQDQQLNYRPIGLGVSGCHHLLALKGMGLGVPGASGLCRSGAGRYQLPYDLSEP